MFDWRNLTPGVLLARVLDIKCQNCGANTVGLLLARCSRCGYPAPTVLSCPQCGLNIARKNARLCPRCGASVVVKEAGTVTGDNSDSNVQEAASSPEPAATDTVLTPAVESTPPPPNLSPITSAPESPTVGEAGTLFPDVDSPPVVADSTVAPTASETPSPLGEESTITIAQLARLIGNKSRIGLQENAGKTIRLKGIIREVNIEMADDAGAGVVVLMSPDAAVSFTVGCRFGVVYRSVLKRMQPGQRITVLGLVHLTESEVTLEDCMPVG